MRQFCLPLLTISLSFVFATKPAVSQTEAPMQLCTPLLTENCVTTPQWLKKPVLDSHGAADSKTVGVVGLNFVVSADGSAHDMEIVKSSDDKLKEDVIASFQKWKFAPATFQGRPAAVKMRATVQFLATGGGIVYLGPWRASWTDTAELQKLFDDANQAYGRRDYQKAVALSRQLLDLEPLFKRIRLVLGSSLLELQQYDDAEAALKEEIKLDPKSSYAYTRLGVAYQRRSKYDEAIAQYKKQIEVTPDAYGPHADLGVLLCARKRCSEAMPELEKSLALSPGQSSVTLAQGKCDIDLGNTAKGISEMEQAASQAASSGTWDEAAYRLAERNVELDKALAWVEKAIAIRSVFLRDISLDHVTPAQMKEVNATASYWDTLGWIYFRMGKNDQALRYVDAAWRMHPTPTKGDHLGQIYEKLGRQQDAVNAYAMAVASADLSKRGVSSPEDLAEAKGRLTQLSESEVDIAPLIQRGQTALEALSSNTVENLAHHAGSADFILKVVGNQISDVHQVTGDASFASFSDALRKAPLAQVSVPEGSGLEILRRGSLNCKAEAGECQFVLLSTDEAVNVATQESDAAKARTLN